MFLLLTGALALRRDDLAAAWSELGTVAPSWFALLLALAAGATLANGLVAAAISDGVSPARGVMIQQATLAANNTGIGSGPVTLGVRIAMLRSWRVDDVGIAVAVAAVNVVGTTRIWLATLTVSLLGLGGAADDVVARWVVVAAAAAAVVVLVGQAAVWWVILERPGVLARIAGWCQRGAERAGRRWRVAGRLARRVHVPDAAERFRVRGRTVVRERGIAIAAATIAEQAVLMALPIVVVRAFGIGTDVLSNREALLAFVFVRTAAALTAIPGGIGVTEVGLTALLTRAGAPEPDVLGAVLTYRSITFLLPILLGTASFAIWRHSVRKPPSDAVGPLAQPAADGDAAVGGGEAFGELEARRPRQAVVGGEQAERVTALGDTVPERGVEVAQAVAVAQAAAVGRVADHE